MRKIQIGTVISGTLRNEDLLNAFIDELEWLDASGHPDSPDQLPEIYHDAKVIQSKYNTTDECEEPDIEVIESIDESLVSEIVNELMDAINEYRLPYTYFGTHYGDGADFGWWIDFDTMNDISNESESESITQQFRTNGTLSDEEHWIQECSCQEDDCIGKHGLIVHVNDHGNVTLMDNNRKDVWSVV
jgi:hypothetical protein